MRTVPDEAAALVALADPAFDPRRTVVIEAADAPPGWTALAEPASDPRGGIQITNYGAQRISLEATVRSRAFLVLADAFYPGWQAAVDGGRVPVVRGNFLFRAIALEPGRHKVTLEYEAESWQRGVWITILGAALLACALAATSWPKRR